MGIISRYVREQKRYTKNEIKDNFEFDNDRELELFIGNLKSYGIIKTVKADHNQKDLSYLMDEDLIIVDEAIENGECFYVFAYVGIITIGQRIIKVLPKYMTKYDDNNHSENELLEDMRMVIKVLEEYNYSTEQLVKLINSKEENTRFNQLSIMLFLLKDYYENGLYSNEETINEVNGIGQVIWDKTINENIAVVKDNKPYYIETITSKNKKNEYDYFQKLHKYVLTDCSKQLEEAGVSELFDVESIELSNETIDYFGDTDFICYKLNGELSQQFNTRKQVLLKTLLTYISHSKHSLFNNYGVSMFGTTAFNRIWEEACRQVFGNKLDYSLKSLNLDKGTFKQSEEKTLSEIIEKPKWKVGNYKEREISGTLTPDLVCVEKINKTDYFVILDAKYYLLEISESGEVRGNPGISDLTKQYLYQLAFEELIKQNQISVKENCFLLPSEDDKIKKGYASLEMLNGVGLEVIQYRIIPANIVFNKYLSKKRIPLKWLQLDSKL